MSIDLKLSVVHLFTIWQLWSKGQCKIQQQKFFGHPIGDGIFDNIIVVGGGGFTVLRTLA